MRKEILLHLRKQCYNQHISSCQMWITDYTLRTPVSMKPECDSCNYLMLYRFFEYLRDSQTLRYMVVIFTYVLKCSFTLGITKIFLYKSQKLSNWSVQNLFEVRGTVIKTGHYVKMYYINCYLFYNRIQVWKSKESSYHPNWHSNQLFASPCMNNELQ